MTADPLTTPYKMTRHLAKFDGDWTEDDIATGRAGDPTEVLEHSWWYDANGREITDQARIAVLEARANGGGDMAKTGAFDQGDAVTFIDQDGEHEGIVTRVLDGDVYLIATEDGEKGVHADAMTAAPKRPAAKGE